MMTGITHDGIRCMMMRGGTSKGAYFLASDLPADADDRDALLLRILGSPDPRQIDGIGGGNPLTSKVAVVSRSPHPDADVDFCFLQVVVDEARVSRSQTCGNIIAGVGPFAIERGLAPVAGPSTKVRIRIVNPTESFAATHIDTSGGEVRYTGSTMISGVPFPGSEQRIEFPGSPESLYPTGKATETINDLHVTCIDAGMPVVLVLAHELGITGYETPTALEANGDLRAELESLRLQAGRRMGLGDIAATTVPKMSLLAPAQHGGAVSTRTFIPHRVHSSIGVLGAVSVAAGCLDPATVASGFAVPADAAPIRIEHPTGWLDVFVSVRDTNGATEVASSAVVRTARKLFDGYVWPRAEVAACEDRER